MVPGKENESTVNKSGDQKVVASNFSLVEQLIDFLKDFRVEIREGRETRVIEKYREAIRRMEAEGSVSLYVDWEDLFNYDPSLADFLYKDPETFLEAGRIALLNVMRVECPDYFEKVKARFSYPEAMEVASEVHFRIRGLEKAKALFRDLRSVRKSENIGRLVVTKGIVSKVSPTRPELVAGVFKCRTCGFVYVVPQKTRGKLQAPTTCIRCEEEGRKSEGFDLIEDKSVFRDFQVFTLEPSIEGDSLDVEGYSIEVVARDDLVDIVRPGDKVVVAGFVRVDASKSPLKSGLPIYRSYIEAISIEVENKPEVEITPEDEERIREFAKRENLDAEIVARIAPSIHAPFPSTYWYVKLAIALMLAGGVEIRFGERDIPVRGNIHILLVGDPGTAKSELLRYVSWIAPRGIYADSTLASGVGLTASVVQEKESKDLWVLRAGVLPRVNNGVACLDELHRMKKDELEKLHVALEQQVVSVSKAGIVATIPAKVSVLAAVNPVTDRVVDKEPIPEQLNLSPTLLNRFDLIFVIRDKPKPELDRELAIHLSDPFMGHSGWSVAMEDIVFLKKYFTYVRRLRPRLSPEARDRLVEYYTKMRGLSNDPEKPLAITARQFQALLRLTLAHAKLHLRDVATVEDAEVAIELMDYFLRSVAVNPETKEIDIDVIMTGKPSTTREKMLQILNLIDALVRERNGDCVDVEDVVKEAEKRGIEEKFTREVIEKLSENGNLMETRKGCVKKAFA